MDASPRPRPPPAAGAAGGSPPEAPRAEPPGDRGRAAALAAPAPARRRVLVVDDEPLVGRAVARILAADHEVVACTSARAALALLGPDGAAFDLVVCDLMMPGMSGMELHAALAGTPHAGRTVFLTGGAFTPAARDFLERLPGRHLEKPFDSGALRALVARALAGEWEAGP